METIKQLQEILDNAPEGATHVDDDYCYLMFDSDFVWNLCRPMTGWHNIDSDKIGMYCDIRSLSDIKLIVAALKYVDECPCDPDIYPEQLEAWSELQELLSAK